MTSVHRLVDEEADDLLAVRAVMAEEDFAGGSYGDDAGDVEEEEHDNDRRLNCM